MAKYRKKTITRALVEVDAIEWLATNDSWNQLMALGLKNWSPVNSFASSSFCIDQDDEKIEVHKGDYVIKNTNGNFDKCAPDAFVKNYTKVNYGYC